jgi:transketolase
MRTAFISQLVEEARSNDKIFLLIGDLGFSVVEPFAQEFPDRFINVGISEQNMAGIAGGLAMNGFVVYCYSIGNFPTLRCIEQIRNNVAYYNSNVRIVSVGAGYAYGSQGVSHHATEDIGIMRSIPNMTVCTPSDPIEARMLTHLSSTHQGPMYIRLGKAGEKVFHTSDIADYQLGNILPIVQKEDATTAVFTCGSILVNAMEAVTQKELPYNIYTVPVVKPINKGQLCELANKFDSFIVLEEHQKSCGLGSAIVEALSDAYEEDLITKFPRVKRIAINDTFYSVVGNQQYMREFAGLILK